MALYTRKPRTFCFVPACFSTHLWRLGTNQKVFTMLHHLGICKGIKGTRSTVDGIRREFDSKVKTWRDRIAEVSPTTKTSKRFRKRLFSDDGWATEKEDSIDEDPKRVKDPGYAFVWDNTQMELRVRHQCRGKRNEIKLWALMFAVRNRVPASNGNNEDITPCRDIPIEAFLPTPEELSNLKERMVKIVKQILVSHLPSLRGIKVSPRMAHEKSKEMAEKSEVVNLGVVEENPSTIAGVSNILRHLHQYVPVTPGGIPHSIPCHGDGLSVERMCDSLRHNSGGLTPMERLEGIVPVPQEFHKRALLLQDTMNLMFSQRSANSRGSLSQLKAAFQHRNVSTKVIECFNHVWDFIQFVTHAYASMLAMKLIDDSNAPKDLPDDRKAQEAYVHGLAVDVVNHIFLEPEGMREVVRSARDMSDDEYCFCGEGEYMYTLDAAFYRMCYIVYYIE